MKHPGRGCRCDTNASSWLQVTGTATWSTAGQQRRLAGGPEDLVPGTNTFVGVATDRAGLSATNSVWLIYDPTPGDQHAGVHG